jgi:hypothetical protein
VPDLGGEVDCLTSVEDALDRLEHRRRRGSPSAATYQS